MDIRRRNQVTMLGGGGQTVVLAHGFGSNQKTWRGVASELVAKHRVVTFDYVGCGDADPKAYDSQRYSALGGYATDVIEVCDALQLRDCVFIGHSVSGMIGVLASLARPQLFRGLVLIASSPRYLNEPPDYVGGFEQSDVEGLLDLMDQNFVGWAATLADIAIKDPLIALELRDSLCATDPATARQFAEITFYCDLRNVLPKVPAPSLIVQCSRDDIAPVTVGEYMHRALPRSQYQLLDASGHCPQMTHERELSAVLVDYLGRLEWR